MKRQHQPWVLRVVMLSILALIGFAPSNRTFADEAGGSYEAQRQTALKNPYANDFGPKTIDVSSYPPEIQATYNNLFLIRCARCHEPSRPLNSQFLEPYGPPESKDAKIAQWRSSQPELFKDKLVWQPEAKIWNRYVKRMMSKPGCNISNAEGKKIWEFLTYDSEHRKTGANAEKWAAHRRKLLVDFKASHPARYKELYELQ